MSNDDKGGDGGGGSGAAGNASGAARHVADDMYSHQESVAGGADRVLAAVIGDGLTAIANEVADNRNAFSPADRDGVAVASSVTTTTRPAHAVGMPRSRGLVGARGGVSIWTPSKPATCDELAAWNARVDDDCELHLVEHVARLAFFRHTSVALDMLAVAALQHYFKLAWDFWPPAGGRCTACEYGDQPCPCADLLDSVHRRRLALLRRVARALQWRWLVVHACATLDIAQLARLLASSGAGDVRFRLGKTGRTPLAFALYGRVIAFYAHVNDCDNARACVVSLLFAHGFDANFPLRLELASEGTGTDYCPLDWRTPCAKPKYRLNDSVVLVLEAWAQLAGAVIGANEATSPLLQIPLHAFKPWTVGPMDDFGHGAFGVVSSVRWRGADVAVKRYVRRDSKHGVAEAATTEARLMAGLRHAHIVQALGVVYDSNQVHALLLEPVRGGTLRELVESPRVRLTLPTFTRFLHELALALQYVHSRSIVHGDVKPSNCLLSHENPSSASLKLCDFGLAAAVHASTGATGDAGGGGGSAAAKPLPDIVKLRSWTPGYAHPHVSERKLTEAEAFASDVYAFAVTASVLLKRDSKPAMAVSSVRNDSQLVVAVCEHTQMETVELQPKVVKLLRNCIGVRKEPRLVNIARIGDVVAVLDSVVTPASDDDARRRQPTTPKVRSSDSGSLPSPTEAIDDQGAIRTRLERLIATCSDDDASVQQLSRAELNEEFTNAHGVFVKLLHSPDGPSVARARALARRARELGMWPSLLLDLPHADDASQLERIAFASLCAALGGAEEHQQSGSPVTSDRRDPGAGVEPVAASTQLGDRELRRSSSLFAQDLAECLRQRLRIPSADERPENVYDDDYTDASTAADTQLPAITCTGAQPWTNFKKKGEAIGQGVWGRVYAAEWKRDDVADHEINIALKEPILRPAIGQPPPELVCLRNFCREAHLALYVPPHQNVLTALAFAFGDNGTDLPHTAIVFPFIEYAATLEDAMDENRPTLRDQWASAACVRNAALGVSSGMQHLVAARVLHNDLAARNVLGSVPPGTQLSAVVWMVADYGHARQVAPGRADYSLTKLAKETLPRDVAAPELLKTDALTARPTELSDVYSFGVTLRKLLGVATAAGASAAALAEFLALSSRCCHAEPLERPSFAECVRQLEQME